MATCVAVASASLSSAAARSRGAPASSSARGGTLSFRTSPLPARGRGGFEAPALRPRTSRRTAAAAAAGEDAAPLQTPHSGYHLDDTGRRFFEGWYLKVALPEQKQAFAFMYSAEDQPPPSAAWKLPVPGPAEVLAAVTGSGRFAKRPGIGAQIMGPDDGYIVQYSPDVRPFWAAPHALQLGCLFDSGASKPAGGMLPEGQFWAREEASGGHGGFQASATWHQGTIHAAEAGVGVGPSSSVPTARWAYSIKPLAGWGDADGPQRATAGWLAALPVFEPHWQILMAHGLATGYIEWGGWRYDFVDAPAYAEKNWGGAFPTKWFWVQCNTWEGWPGLALTAGGGVRGIPVLNRREDVAMIGIHLDGKFIELVPWAGEVEWNIAPWGSWCISGRSVTYEAELVADCAPDAGCVLRAPTASDGLAAACKDTFFGRATLHVWRRTPDGRRGEVVVDGAKTSTAALEVGGGPWWTAWVSRAQMTEPLRSALALPVDVNQALKVLPTRLQPPGL